MNKKQIPPQPKPDTVKSESMPLYESVAVVFSVLFHVAAIMVLIRMAIELLEVVFR